VEKRANTSNPPVGPVAQEGNQRRFSLQLGKVERGHVVVHRVSFADASLGLQIRTIEDEMHDDFIVVTHCCEMKWGPALVVAHVHVHAAIQKEHHQGQISRLRRNVEGVQLVLLWQRGAMEDRTHALYLGCRWIGAI